MDEGSQAGRAKGVRDIRDHRQLGNIQRTTKDGILLDHLHFLLGETRGADDDRFFEDSVSG